VKYLEFGTRLPVKVAHKVIIEAEWFAQELARDKRAALIEQHIEYYLEHHFEAACRFDVACLRLFREGDWGDVNRLRGIFCDWTNEELAQKFGDNGLQVSVDWLYSLQYILQYIPYQSGLFTFTDGQVNVINYLYSEFNSWPRFVVLP
jgi:hypothetical protein